MLLLARKSPHPLRSSTQAHVGRQAGRQHYPLLTASLPAPPLTPPPLPPPESSCGSAAADSTSEASAGQNCRKAQPGYLTSSLAQQVQRHWSSPLPTPPPAGFSSRRHHQIFAQELQDLKGIKTSKGQGMPPLPWQCQLLQQGRAREEDQSWGDMQGYKWGTHKNKQTNKPPRAGTD